LALGKLYLDRTIVDRNEKISFRYINEAYYDRNSALILPFAYCYHRSIGVCVNSTNTSKFFKSCITKGTSKAKFSSGNINTKSRKKEKPNDGTSSSLRGNPWRSSHTQLFMWSLP
jgi:hypothetical protein